MTCGFAHVKTHPIITSCDWSPERRKASSDQCVGQVLVVQKILQVVLLFLNVAEDSNVAQIKSGKRVVFQ